MSLLCLVAVMDSQGNMTGVLTQSLTLDYLMRHVTPSSLFMHDDKVLKSRFLFSCGESPFRAKALTLILFILFFSTLVAERVPTTPTSDAKRRKLTQEWECEMKCIGNRSKTVCNF